MSKNWRPKTYQSISKQKLLAWEPEIIQDGPTVYLKLNPGTVNGILPINWQTRHTVKPDDINYIKLKVTSSTGNINSVTIEVSPSKDDSEQQASVNLPPSIFKILIGIYFKGNYYMIYDRPIAAAPIVLYTKTKNADFGAEPYSKYYIWQVIS